MHPVHNIAYCRFNSDSMGRWRGFQLEYYTLTLSTCSPESPCALGESDCDNDGKFSRQFRLFTFCFHLQLQTRLYLVKYQHQPQHHQPRREPPHQQQTLQMLHWVPPQPPKVSTTCFHFYETDAFAVAYTDPWSTTTKGTRSLTEIS